MFVWPRGWGVRARVMGLLDYQLKNCAWAPVNSASILLCISGLVSNSCSSEGWGRNCIWSPCCEGGNWAQAAMSNHKLEVPLGKNINSVVWSLFVHWLRLCLSRGPRMMWSLRGEELCYSAFHEYRPRLGTLCCLLCFRLTMALILYFPFIEETLNNLPKNHFKVTDKEAKFF